MVKKAWIDKKNSIAILFLYFSIKSVIQNQVFLIFSLIIKFRDSIQSNYIFIKIRTKKWLTTLASKQYLLHRVIWFPVKISECWIGHYYFYFLQQTTLVSHMLAFGAKLLVPWLLFYTFNWIGQNWKNFKWFQILPVDKGGSKRGQRQRPNRPGSMWSFR